MANKPALPFVPRPAPLPLPPPAVQSFEELPMPLPPAAAQVPERVRETNSHSQRTFWGDDCNFANVATHNLAALWALCALKASYTDSSVSREAFRVKVGADSVTVPIAGSSLMPPVMRIDYPDYIVLVVRGTTTNDQIAMFRSANLVHYQLKNEWLETGGRTTSIIGNGTNPHYFGLLFDGFVALAEQLHSYLNSITFATTTKKIYLVGHSLGAAIIDLACLVMSKKRQALMHQPGALPSWAAGVYTEAKLNGIDKNLRGGYLFGQPRVGLFNYPNIHQAVGGGITYPNTPPGASPNAWRNFIHNYFSLRLKHMAHQLDPVALIPTTFSGSPWYVWWASNGGATSSLELGRGSADYHPGFYMEGEREEQRPTFPPTVANFTSRCSNYHTSGQLLRMVSNGLVRHHTSPPDAWVDLIDWALELNGDSSAPSFS